MTEVCTRIGTCALSVFVLLPVVGCQEPTSGAGGRARSSWRSAAPQPNPALQSLVDSRNLELLVSGRRAEPSGASGPREWIEKSGGQGAPDQEQTPAERTRLVDQVRRFYRGMNYQLIWTDGDRPSKRYGDLIKVFHKAADHGLPIELYKVPLESSLPAPERDVRVTTSFFRYFLHLTGGRLDPRAVAPLWTLRPEKPDLVSALTDAVQTNNLADTLERLQPLMEEYRELRKALKRYRSIAAKGGWPAIAGVSNVTPGEQSPVVPALRKRLAMEGDLDASHENDPSQVFDARLVEAVKRFEERHRLTVDGIVDSETLKAMNVPVEARIRTIELNLERWRWLPDKMPARYLVVNIPDFRLEAIENGRPVMAMRIIVGAPDNKTPIFADEMTHVIFSPYWNVPPNIAREETIPRVLNDPGFLARNNMEVVGPSGEVVNPYSIDWSNPAGLRIRQRPGSRNALGGVKFVFPNTFDVYLHDTNAGALFNRIERALSHGCVRVEEPHALAKYVLRDFPEWTPEAIQQAMQSGREKHVKLREPIPVYILYKTVWVHEGGVRFLKDLYGYDADHSAKLWPGSEPRAAPPRLNNVESRR